MKFSKKILLFITCCFAAAISVAQQIKSVSAPDSYRAIHWAVEDGLPVGSTYTMFKDAKGFLWVGGGGSFASGLCRFDGAIFKRYGLARRKEEP